MSLIHIIFSVFFLLDRNLNVDGATDYCAISSCPKRKEHTMCKYNSSDPVDPCKILDIKKMIPMILARHNACRNSVACFREPPQPPASNMMRLRWDNELQKIAERWGAQCEMKHDYCRNVPRFSVGQNMAAASYDMGDPFVQLWINEMKIFKPEGVSTFRNQKGTGHYTQVVWAKSQFIGCAYIYAPGETLKYRLWCNYGPPGNVMYSSVYKIGEPQSECPEDAKDEFYKGLCDAWGPTAAVIRVAPTTAVLVVVCLVALQRVAGDSAWTRALATVAGGVSVVLAVLGALSAELGADTCARVGAAVLANASASVVVPDAACVRDIHAAIRAGNVTVSMDWAN